MTETFSKKHENLKEYYGKILNKTTDLKTNACCVTGETFPPAVKKILPLINYEIIEKFYGCGSPIPPVIEGCTVLDLGCGTGRDVYITSALTGETGYVIGVDMTDEQLDVARRNIDSQMTTFGYNKPNVDFRKGYIEDLTSVKIKDNSVDVVISNCVINLSPDKQSVLSEIFRVLKPGGELFFSDVFSGRRIPSELKYDPVLHGECLGGALYIEDFRRIVRDLGCLDFRIVSKRPFAINNREIENKIGMIDFYSITMRVFKLKTLEDICEDYGQTAVYKGTIPGYPHKFDFDDHHVFTTGKPVLVCGNTASMLSETRYSDYFTVQGDRSTHFGAFECECSRFNAITPERNATPSCC